MMITRRDFIRGLGAAAVAGVMPKVEVPEAETLHVKFTEAELVYRYTWNPETGEETLVTGANCRLFIAKDDCIENGMRVFLDGVDVSDYATECYASIHPDTPVQGWVKALTDNIAPLTTEIKCGKVYWREDDEGLL